MCLGGLCAGYIRHDIDEEEVWGTVVWTVCSAVGGADFGDRVASMCTNV